VSSRLRGMLRNLDAGEEKSRKPVETAACYCRRVEPGAGAPPPRRCTSASLIPPSNCPVRGTKGAARLGLEVRPVPGMAGAAPVAGTGVDPAEVAAAPLRASWHPLTNAMLTIKMPTTLEMLSAKSLFPLASPGL